MTTNLPPLFKISIPSFNIVFNDVNFKYDKTNDRALKSLNLKIEGGKMSALVGHSGAGKSTIINLLARFYDPQKGYISIDGNKINEVNLSSLRKNISLVSQDVILFDDTIKANIGYGNISASDDEIIEAAKKAGVPDSQMLLVEGEVGILAAMKAGRADAAVQTFFGAKEHEEKTGGAFEVTDPKLMPKETVNVVGIGFRKSDSKFRSSYRDLLGRHRGV